MSISSDLVQTVKQAHRRHLKPENLRARLVQANIPKGTTSKCVTILVCLNRGVFRPDDFKSLSGGYQMAQVATAATNHIKDGSTAPIIRPVINLGFQKP